MDATLRSKGIFYFFSLLTRSLTLATLAYISGLTQSTRDSLIQSHSSTLSSRLVQFDTKELVPNSLSGRRFVGARPRATNKDKLVDLSYQPDEESVISISDEDDSVLTVYGIFFLTYLLHNIC
jgi:hypothetical protein